MKTWNELTHFGGLDWAEFRQKMAGYPAWGVALETRSGAAVEELLQSDGMVFPVQPKAAAHYRERKAPSGVKDDQLDAWAMADALRLDGRNWRALSPEDPLLQELRLLCRDEVALIEQRTALVNQLRAVGMVEARREVRGKLAVERRYSLSSLPLNVATFARAVREHWGAENQLHWVLDVQMNEDQNRARSGHAAENLSLLRRLVLNQLRRDTRCQTGIKGKQLNAAWDHAYLQSLLGF